MRPGRSSLVACVVLTALFGLSAGCSQSVVGKASPDFAKVPRTTKEEQTARNFVQHMMNFDYRNMDEFSKNMTTGVSGDLAKTTDPQRIDAVKALFIQLEATSSFTIASSSVLEDKPDRAVITVAGLQTLRLKSDPDGRTLSTIVTLTVQKADQTISSLEALGPDGKPSGGGDFSSEPH